jgi:NAD(P)-dependent dehydrogenase (short-subunit alcohol dehydrogenase family)
MAHQDSPVAVVTGASRGIGAAVARRFQREGWRVAALARTADHGVGDLAVACDVADEAAQVKAFAQVDREFGRVDAAFVNAGTNGYGPVADLDLADWDRVLGTNLRGAAVTMREAARRMRDAGRGGAIVTCCSLTTFAPEKNLASYSASKAALASLTRTAARELGPAGIRVNGVAPGFIETDLVAGAAGLPGFYDAVRRRTPLGARLGTADDVADAVMALLAMPWVTGQVLVVDGGLSLQTPTDPTEFF